MVRRGDNSFRLFCCFFTILCLFVIWPSIAAGSNNEVKLPSENGKEIVLYKESYALVIGVSDYKEGWPKLLGVKEDIQAVATILSKHGFSVVVVENPTHEQLDKAFDDFISQYGHKFQSRLLFYFAGHGYTAKQSYGEEMGYIVAADTPAPRKDLPGFLSKAIDMQQMEVYAKRIQSKHAIFVFDSCFSGSIFSMARSLTENISYKTTKPVRQFITSGSAKEEVPDVSIFRKMFIHALIGEGDLNKDGYVTGTELGEFLQEKVINYSKGAQHPQYGKIRSPQLDKGDFVFVVGDGSDVSEDLNSEKQIEVWEEWKKDIKREKKKDPVVPLPSF